MGQLEAAMWRLREEGVIEEMGGSSDECPPAETDSDAEDMRGIQEGVAAGQSFDFVAAEQLPTAAVVEQLQRRAVSDPLREGSAAEQLPDSVAAEQLPTEAVVEQSPWSKDSSAE